MQSRVEEVVTAIEYNRVMHRIANTTDENEKIQLRSVAKWLGDKLDSYRRGNDRRVQGNEKVNNSGEARPTLCVLWKKDNERK